VAVCQHGRVAGFDAERYLRLAGDRWVREGGRFDRPPWNPVLAVTGAALVASGAMTTGAAQAVMAGYWPLTPYEDHNRLVTGQGAQQLAAAPPGIGQLRVVPCQRVIGQPWGELVIHYVAFTDDATTLRVTVRPDQAHGDPFGRLVLAGARTLEVTSEQGTAVTGEFFGSSRIGDPVWRGEYEVRPPLAVDAAWIELAGQRVELTGEPVGIQVWTEPLPVADPVPRHLWERVATINDFHDLRLALDTTIATLVADGALAADGPLIGQTRAVLAVLRPGGTEPVARPAGLAEPWRSLMARWGQRGGRPRIVTIGAVTPQFDGVTAAVIAMTSRDEQFGINVELVPGVRTGLPYRDLPGQQHLTWWAADDLGNHYLGEQYSWHFDKDRCGGAIGFWPALPPGASRVDLMPTATAARAVIRVPLPWAEPG
jgi:hypothetical protein